MKVGGLAVEQAVVRLWVENEYLCEFLRKYLGMGLLFRAEALQCGETCTLLECRYPKGDACLWMAESEVGRDGLDAV